MNTISAFSCFCLSLFLFACRGDTVKTEEFYHRTNWGAHGGTEDFLKLPFPSGNYWSVTQMYNEGSHKDWGFRYGDDSYALDFARSGCETYGQEITPVLAGTVMRVEQDDGERDGYGNSVLIEHENGYVSRYAHLSDVFVVEGEELLSSSVIGLVGNTGYVVGSSCGEHAGAHLHLAFYQDGEAVPPEPLSGADLSTGCWYNREGDESCSGDPGSYPPVYDDGDGESYGDLFVRVSDVSPRAGIAGETQFTFVTVVHSPVEKPEANLYIYNDADGLAYAFEMSSHNDSSPYVFTYQKTMRDAQTYEYWIEVDQGSFSDEGPKQSFETTAYGSPPEIRSVSVTPDDGEAGVTTFEWVAWADSYDWTQMELKIVNARDAEVYSFSMDMEDDGAGIWSGWYDKTLRDPGNYAYWVEAKNGDGGQTSEVEEIRVR